MRHGNRLQRLQKRNERLLVPLGEILAKSVPGVFAAGDVRFGALTGISSAVGEGAMAIRFTRKYLEDI